MAVLAPSPKFRAVGADGLALVGGKLWSYTAGTSTPKDTYVSIAGAANTNPVILDSRGEADVWLNGNYKLTLLDSNDAQIWSVDDIRDLTSSATLTNATLAGTLTVTSTAVTWSGNPTHSGNHTFTNNVVVNGSTTLGDSSADTLTIKPNAVTWTNGVTHAGANTFTDAVVMNGAVTAGNAAADVVTVNGTTTFPLAVTTHTFGAKFGNVARADASTLDWYERATWTPFISTSAGSGITYSTQLGTATRIGNRCFFEMWLTLSSLGTASGNCYIDGLPFTVKTEVPSGIDGYPVTIGQASSFTGLTGALGGQCHSASTRIYLHQSAAAGTASIGISVFTASSNIYISGQYRI